MPKQSRNTKEIPGREGVEKIYLVPPHLISWRRHCNYLVIMHKTNSLFQLVFAVLNNIEQHLTLNQWYDVSVYINV